MIRHVLLAAASAAAFSLAVSAARAADLPISEPAPAIVAVPSFSWTGFYLGAQAGYGWQRSANQSQNGWILGAFAGYNYHFDGSPLVVGVETDFNWTNQDGRKAERQGVTKVEKDWNGATRARIGVAIDHALVYAAGGVAYEDREMSRSPGTSKDKTAVGWTVGGGVDVAVTDNVFVRGEYRYSDYGKDTFRLARTTLRSSATEHRVMGAVAYKFD